MANTASLVDISGETRATFLAKIISLGTISDLLEASKKRPVAGDPDSLAAWRDLVDDFILDAYDLIKTAAALPTPLTGSGTWSSDGASYSTLLDLGTIGTGTAWFFTGEICLSSTTGTVTNSVIVFRGTARRSAGSPTVTALGVLSNGNQAGANARSLVSSNNILLQALSSSVDTISYTYTCILTQIVPT
jgi:hypothetical protein